MRKINTLGELREEKKRLLQRKEELDLAIKKDMSELKEELEPGHIMAKAAGKLISGKQTGFLGYTAGSLISFVVKKTILRKPGFLAKFAVDYAARNIIPNLLSNNKRTIFNWFSSLFQKSTNVKSDFSDRIHPSFQESK